MRQRACWARPASQAGFRGCTPLCTPTRAHCYWIQDIKMAIEILHTYGRLFAARDAYERSCRQPPAEHPPLDTGQNRHLLCSSAPLPRTSRRRLTNQSWKERSHNMRSRGTSQSCHQLTGKTKKETPGQGQGQSVRGVGYAASSRKRIAAGGACRLQARTAVKQDQRCPRQVRSVVRRIMKGIVLVGMGGVGGERMRRITRRAGRRASRLLGCLAGRRRRSGGRE